jgi:NADH-quinone oxidoreductase subunit H
MSGGTQVWWYGFVLLIFPGFLFTAAAGLLASWVDRFVTARVQWRVGPPLAQPLYDVVKLLGKETMVPEGGNRVVFFAAPLAALAGATAISPILWIPLLGGGSFLGDLIVVVYLLIIPPACLILGGFASGNPLAALGASREMKLILAYELPFLASLTTVIARNGFSILISDLAHRPPVIASVSGALAFLGALLCVQAKLGYPPFDVAEAETEIIAGPLVEYSGALLGLWKLAQSMMLFVLPVFIVAVFFGGFNLGGWGVLWVVPEYVLVLALIVVIKNTNPRVRIDQAVKFFWRGVFPLMAAAFVLAVIGRTYGISWL